MYVQLFGLLNIELAGSLSVPVYYWAGNGLGFNDWNANQDLTQIGSQNNPYSSSGDPLGAKQLIKDNLLSTSTEIIDEVIHTFEQAGLTSKPPTASPFNTQ